jgi:NADPH:quinone reductase-like Zn-dependent oxidoreductase
MRAITYTRLGDPSVLELVEKPVPEPGDGEVRVRVLVSGVNPTDWKSRSGTFGGTLADRSSPSSPPNAPSRSRRARTSSSEPASASRPSPRTGR